MLKELKAFFSDLTGEAEQPHFQDNDYRLAAAALMVHVATLDRDLSESERLILHRLLQSRFELSEAMTAELVDAAVAADQEAVDFYQFTQTLMRVLDEPGRQRIIEMLWELAYADDKISEFEDNMIWRIADLLGISAQQRLALKGRVAGERAE